MLKGYTLRCPECGSKNTFFAISLLYSRGSWYCIDCETYFNIVTQTLQEELDEINEILNKLKE